MKKDTDMEQVRKDRRERLQQNIEKQLEMLAGIIQELLAGVDMTSLTAKERLVMSTRFIALYQHGLGVDGRLEGAQEEEHESLAFSTIIQNLKVEKKKEGYRVIDAEIVLPPGMEDNLED